MAKRLSIQTKKEILNLFTNSKFSIEQLSKKFECTNATVTRNLKKELGNEKYQEIIASNDFQKNSKNSDEVVVLEENKNKDSFLGDEEVKFDFVELAPLDYEIENITRKEISSVPIKEVEFPKVVYMVVNKNIELEIKLLNDYPEWEFLPNQDLKRKTIEIYIDLKSARRACLKEQKVIKVPNTDVFRIVAPILISRGISRIICSEQLIAL